MLPIDMIGHNSTIEFLDQADWKGVDVVVTARPTKAMIDLWKADHL
jgi:hypothetical protein